MKAQIFTKKSLLCRSAAISATVLLTSCASYQPDPYVNRIKGDVALTSTADVSHTLLIETETGRKVCIQPPADASFAANNSEGTDIAIVAFGGKQNGKQERKEETDESQFAGRTPSVLITREVLYRLCEMTLNQNLSQDEVLASFNDAVKALSESWKMEAGRTSIEIKEDTVGDPGE